MKRNIIVIFFGITLIILSCKDSIVNNVLDSGFSFKVIVSNSSSLPLSDISVSTWNKLKNTTSLPKAKTPNKIQASTSIQFLLKENSFVSLNIYNLDNSLQKSLAKKESLKFGNYIFSYSDSIGYGTRVFKCKMSVTDDSNSTTSLYEDSIYTVLLNPFPELAKVGATNQQGEFTTNDMLLFPNLYNLPPLLRTSSHSSEIIGTFEISNTVVISLTNEQTHIVKYFEKEIYNDENVFNLVWEEGATEHPGWELSSYQNINGKTNEKSSLKKLNDNNSFQAVEFTSFMGKKAESGVQLNWGTATEVDNYGFEVHRKINNWETIGFVEGNNNSIQPNEYSFLDNSLIVGNIKYRLKQIDNDGGFYFSDSIVVQTNIMENILRQNYPNPYN